MNDKVAIILGSENDKKYVEGSYKYFEYFSISIKNSKYNFYVIKT